MSFDGLPDSWVVWNDEDGGNAVLVFRPDVFDSAAFPPECLPTISLAAGSPDRPPGELPAGENPWYVVLYLEPDVRARGLDASYGSREAATAGAVDLAAEFARGEVDYRDLYQVPREAYLDRLDDLTGRDA